MKRDTKKGKLNKKLYECLNKPPQNSKKTQTTNSYNTNNCQCALNKRKRHTVSESPKDVDIQMSNLVCDNYNLSNNHISTVTSMQNNYSITYPHSDTIPPMQTEVPIMTQVRNTSAMPVKRMSVESQDSDELMMQLEKLFQGDPNDDDFFENNYYDKMDSIPEDQTKPNLTHESVIENHSAQIKLLGEKLTNLAGMIESTDNVPQKTEIPNKRKSGTSKWLCEEYFLKQKLYELLDQIGDTDRKKLEKVQDFTYFYEYDSTLN